jgi:MFS family permease
VPPWAGASAEHFLDIFKGGMLKTTVLASLMFTGMQGGYYAIAVWLPTFLKNERHLTVLGSGGYQFMFIFGAFAGYLCGAYASDRLGRRLAFTLFAIGAGSLAYAYALLPITDAWMLVLGFPLGFFMSGIFSGAGAFLAELFPNELRGSGQGFCYNFGRGIGATFPALVGVFSDRLGLSLGMAIGICATAGYVVVLFAMCLPETRAGIWPRSEAGQTGHGTLSSCPCSRACRPRRRCGAAGHRRWSHGRRTAAGRSAAGRRWRSAFSLGVPGAARSRGTRFARTARARTSPHGPAPWRSAPARRQSWSACRATAPRRRQARGDALAKSAAITT